MPNKQALQNPFPGLRPFQSDEEHLFFGRENQTLELLQILRDNRFVGVIGTSGSGKSSLVRCGLLSELYGGSFLDAGTDWEVAVMNPGGGPFSQLSKALVNADIYDSEEDDIHLKLNATLRRSRLGLVETIRQADMPEGTNFLLVVDQFEEIFRYSEAGEEEGEAADDFIAMLLEAAKQTNVPIYVIITMRSDYIGDCSKFEGLPEEINEGEYLIPRLTREEYKSVIEGPVKVGGGKLAPRLLQRLLNDIGTEADQLPCLQHALMRTWDAWVDRKDTEELDLEDYRAIGGMSKALSIHADEIFGTFQKASTKDTATKMFRAITEKGDDNRGIRRPLRLQQLADITNKSLDDVKRVIEPYRQPGVTFIMPPSNRELEANTIVDISHESLMRVWQRLRNWVEEEAQSARVYRRLVDTSSLWKKGEAGLYHDPDLQIAQSWRDQYEPNKAWADLYGGGFDVASEFLEASEEEGRREEREKELARQKELEQAQELADARAKSARNMKRFAAVVGVVAVIALAAMGFAVKAQKAAELAQNEANKARESAEIAEENVKKEFARSDNSLGNSFADSNPRLALAHFSRSLEVEPNNPNAVDRSFNILAYQNPPLSQFVDFSLNSNQFITSTSNPSGKLIATTERGSNPRLSIWDPMQIDPIIEIPFSNGNNLMYQGLDFHKQGNLLAVGYNQGNDSQILQINEDNTYETKSYILRGHIGSVKFSSDGSKLLTGSWKQKTTDIWNTETGESIFSVTSGSWYPKWSPDEKSILLGRHQGRVAAVVDIESGEIKEFQHEEIIWHNAAFDPSGRKILTFGKPAPTEPIQNYYIWDVSSQKIDLILNHENKSISETVKKHSWENNDGTGMGISYSVGSFSPDSQAIITAATDQIIRLWNTNSGELIDSLKIPKLPARDQNPIFSNDGNRMALPLRDGTCYIFNFRENYSNIPPLSDSVSLSKAFNFIKNENTLRGITYPLPNIISAHLNKDCNLLFLGSRNGLAALFDASSGEQVDSTFIHPGEIHEIATSLDGTKFATASNLGTIRIWELGNNKPISEIGELDHESKTRITKIHFSGDGNFLWIHTPNGSKRLTIANGEISNTEISLSGKLAYESTDGDTFANTKNQSVTLNDSKGIIFSADAGNSITSLAISSDSNLIASGLSDGSIKLWNIESKKSDILQADPGISILSVSISEDNTYLAAASSSGKLSIFGIATANINEVLVIEGEMACTNTTFNSDNKSIGAVFNDGSKGYAQVWNLDTGAKITPKLQNGTPITNIEFTDDGNSILVWPDNKLYAQNSGISTKWEISISEQMESSSSYTSLISQLGGLKLDDNSAAIRNDKPIIIDEIDVETASENRSNHFLKWVLTHPSSRPDSPFRENLTEIYLNKLSESNSIELLSEAIRLNKEDKISLLKRGILLMSKSSEIGDPNYVLGYSDLIKAEKIKADSDFINCLTGMSHQLLGKDESSKQIYENIKSSEKLDIDQLENLIGLHEITNSPSTNTLILIDKIIDQSNSLADKYLEKKYIVRKFLINCLDNNYLLATKLWNEITNWSIIPEEYNSKSLLSSYIETVESEATKLSTSDNIGDAVEILTPAAIASLAQDPEQISSTITKLFEITSGKESSFELIPSNSEWIYLADGTDQGTEWKQPWFPTEGWSKGRAKLGYGGDGETTELPWGPNINNKYRTYYFRHQFNIEKNQKTPFLLAKVVRDDGVVVYINGKEVIRDYMPDGKIDYSTYASKTAQGSLGDEIKEHQFQISGDYLEIGNNVIAAEVHQVNNSSSDLGFQLTLTGANQTPISLISNLLVDDVSNELLDKAVKLIPKSERLEKEVLIKKLITTYKLELACKSDNFAESKNLWKKICDWKVWPDGIDKVKLSKSVLMTVQKHSKTLFENGDIDSATKILLPTAISTLVDDDPNRSSSFETLFKWSHPDIEITNLVPEDAAWKYFDDGSDLGTAWKEIDFNDHNWKTGQAKLGYGNDGEQTVLTYGDDDTIKHITYYFRHEFNFDGESIPKNLTANLIRDDGAIVYLNGEEVIRSQMPAGEINYQTLASGHASGTNERLAVPYKIDPSKLIKGKNVIAAEIHQDDLTSSDIGFSLSINATDLKIEDYIYKTLKSNSFKEQFENSFSYLPVSQAGRARNAFRFSLEDDINFAEESTDLETFKMALLVLGKLNRLEVAERLTKIKLDDKDLNTSSEAITELKESLRSIEISMKTNGSSEESLKLIRSIIVQPPPRNGQLDPKQLDLSNHYNATVYHHSGWHGNHENFDLRFLPERYKNSGDIPFDIRGIIQLESGTFAWSNGNTDTANSTGFVQGLNQFYPNEVKDIPVNSTTSKIHFLMSSIFGREETGISVAKFVIHYEDNTHEEKPIIYGDELLDWMHVSESSSVKSEAVGWIGPNNLGNSRILTKPVWNNPFPKKVISHIDFISELKAAAPFVVGITLE